VLASQWSKLAVYNRQFQAYSILVSMNPGLQLQKLDHSKLSKNKLECIAKLSYCFLVGGLFYLSIKTHPDIFYAVQQLSQYFNLFSFTHYNATIRVVQYLKGTKDLQLTLDGNKTLLLIEFTDLD